MDYILVAIAVAGLAMQFSATKFYQLRFGASAKSSLRFSALCGLAASLIFFCVDGFKFETTPFSLLCAAGVALLSATYTLIGFKVIKYGPMSVYMMFLMLGGMLLPYLYGVFFLGEGINPYRVVGVVLLAFSLVLPCLSSFGKSGTKWYYWLMCFAVFVLNGGVSIVSKLHQIEETRETVEAVGFVTLSNLISGLITLVIFLLFSFVIKNKKDEASAPPAVTSEKKPSLLLIPLAAFAAAAFGGGSYVLQLVGAASLPATVLYPMVTGGTVVLTALAARIFYKEKPDKLTLCALLLSFLATFLFLAE